MTRRTDETPIGPFRVRTRIVTTRTATGPYRGPEVQVVGARGRVYGRFDFEDQAQAWIARQAKREPT